MSVKSEKVFVKQYVCPTFPCLRSSVSTGCVVLFTRSTVGFVLHPGTTNHEIGHYSTEWVRAEDNSVWMKCSITLTSED